MKKSGKDLLLSHPEIRDLFRELLMILPSESDRGAVLVGSAFIERHLRSFFDAIVPSALGKKKRESLLDNTSGPLGTFSARVEVAYATRLISRALYDALHVFRRIRNEVAHHPKSFNLRKQAARVRQMYLLGPDVPVAVNRMALEVMTYIKVGNALDSVKHPEEDRPYFNTSQEVMEFISEDPEIIEILDEQLPRYELAVGIVLICALLTSHREAALRIVGPDGSLNMLDRDSEHQGQADVREESQGV